MIASIQGKPVFPEAHLARASGFLSHGIWKNQSKNKKNQQIHIKMTIFDL